MDASTAFQNLIVMAAADGSMNESEMRLLADRAVQWGIDDPQFSRAIEAALSGRAELTIPAAPDQRRELLKQLIQMMAADGHLEKREKKLFAVAATAMEIDDDELNTLIDEVLAEQDGV